MLTCPTPVSEQAVDNYEYELASDFEDEEIDEETAFTAEDKKMYAGMFGMDEGAEEDAAEPVLLASDDDEADADRVRCQLSDRWFHRARKDPTCCLAEAWFRDGICTDHCLANIVQLV
jgi:hypothetical protein